MYSINLTEVVSGDASNTALAADWSPQSHRYVTADRLVGDYWSGAGLLLFLNFCGYFFQAP